MDEKANGQVACAPQMSTPQPGQTVTADQAIAIIEQALGPAMTILVTGTRASFPGFPIPLVMLAACKVMGRLVGGTFAGVNAPLQPLMKARSDCREMFEKAMKGIPLTASGGSNGPAMPLDPNLLKPRG